MHTHRDTETHLIPCSTSLPVDYLPPSLPLYYPSLLIPAHTPIAAPTDSSHLLMCFKSVPNSFLSFVFLCSPFLPCLPSPSSPFFLPCVVSPCLVCRGFIEQGTAPEEHGEAQTAPQHSSAAVPGRAAVQPESRWLQRVITTRQGRGGEVDSTVRDSTVRDMTISLLENRLSYSEKNLLINLSMNYFVFFVDYRFENLYKKR